MLALAACAGQRKDAPVAATPATPSAWRDIATQDSTLEEQIDTHWWQAFGDPVLTQLIEDVLVNNTDLAIAAMRVEQARAQTALAHAQRMPGLAADGEGGRQGDLDAFGRARRQNDGQIELTLAYEVDLFGQPGGARHRQAGAGSNSGEQLHSATRAGYSPLLELRQAEAEQRGGAVDRRHGHWHPAPGKRAQSAAGQAPAVDRTWQFADGDAVAFHYAGFASHAAASTSGYIPGRATIGGSRPYAGFGTCCLHAFVPYRTFGRLCRLQPAGRPNFHFFRWGKHLGAVAGWRAPSRAGR